ncbi:MAG: recombinase family protein [Candidatus Doudnabacteria bacterium]
MGSIVDLMDGGQLQKIRTYGQEFSNNPNEKFLLMILGSQAKLENDNRGINVKRGLRTRVELGFWPNMAPLGYLNQKRTDRKGVVIQDPQRALVIKQMFEKVAHEKWSGRKLYHWLRFELNFYTRGNRPVTLSAVYKILQSTFYYGEFEYPRNSGNVYQGRHKPIITKELFDKVQEQLKRNNISRQSKEFAFTKMFICGKCGSGISAEEKWKELKNGGSNKYIYYSCTRAKDRFCKNKYIREKELIDQLAKIIDYTDIDELGIKKRLELEVSRFNKFQSSVLGIKSVSNNKDADIKNYAKYLLKEGSISEKRLLLSNLKSKIKYEDKILKLV